MMLLPRIVLTLLPLTSHATPHLLLRPTVVERITEAALFPRSTARSPDDPLEISLPPLSREVALSPDWGALALKTGPLRLRFPAPFPELTGRFQENAGELRGYHGSGELPEFEFHIPKLSVILPAGVLDRPVEITAEKATLRWSSRAAPLRWTAELGLTTSAAGLELTVVDVDLRIPTSPDPDLRLEMGRLQIDGKPFEPSLTGTPGGPTLSEARLRSWITSALLSSIRKHLPEWESAGEAALTRALKGLLPSKPLTLKADLSSMIPGLSLEAFPEKPLVDESGVLQADLRLVPRHREAPLSLNLNSGNTPPELPASADAGLFVSGTDLDGILELPEIQRILRDELLRLPETPGVTLLPRGIHARFVASPPALSILLPLEIDLIQTLSPDAPLRERIRVGFGDWMETWFGSGRSVILPLEILAVPSVHSGNLRVSFHPPIPANHVYTIPEHCPPEVCSTNVDRMFRRVRKNLLQTLRGRFQDRLPETLEFPARNLQKVEVTPERDLWITFGET